MTKYDIIIIGGGPAGSACALTLANYTNYKVAIIELKEFNDLRVGETVNSSIVNILDYLRVPFDKYANFQVPSYGHAAAWGSDDLIYHSFIHSGEENGLHLNRLEFDRMLLKEATISGVTVFQPCNILSFNNSINWKLTISYKFTNFDLTAQYLIDCSGKSAFIVRNQACPLFKDDQFLGVYSYHSIPDKVSIYNRTLIESAEFGWYYLSPLPGRKIVIGFFTDTDIFKKLNLLKMEVWKRQLMKTKYVSQVFKNLPKSETIRYFPVKSYLALLPQQANWTAAGDAMASFDPISAYGIGYAMTSGINAAKIADAFLKNDFQIGANLNAIQIDNFDRYMKIRYDFYSREKRWENSIFWKRRQK